MCGRYTLKTPKRILENHFQVSIERELNPHYNIAPTQEILIVRLNDAKDTTPVSDFVRWGLIPSWAKDRSIAHKLINARSETVAEKPSFREAVKKRRCLIPADGFFEWKKVSDGKQPYYFSRPEDQLFAFAGIWEQWCDDTDGKAIKTCSILTKTPDPVVSRIHGRMPVILPIANYAAWLSNSTSFSELSKLWEVPTALAVWRVSKTVNSPVEDSPKCIEPEVAEEV